MKVLDSRCRYFKIQQCKKSDVDRADPVPRFKNSRFHDSHLDGNQFSKSQG